MSTRRLAERMILERAARCQQISQDLREMANRLEIHQAGGAQRSLPDEANELRSLADRVLKL
jgi:hypothetical protein